MMVWAMFIYHKRFPMLEIIAPQFYNLRYNTIYFPRMGYFYYLIGKDILSYFCRAPLCRYDLVLMENTETVFQPILCPKLQM